MATEAREHIEEIRRTKFSIGGEPSLQTRQLLDASTALNTELFTRDLDFINELIQNAEDNEYLPGVKPSLEFVMTTSNIRTDALETLLVLNNEVGFSKQDVESICSIRQSKKKGKRHDDVIGEKGIGFKSVFLISKQPYIFSNGYQIRFSEEPNPDCGIRFIVPEWVDEGLTFPEKQHEHSSKKICPTTVIILPLRSEKVDTVRRQLSDIHPEILLFSKIRDLTVKLSRYVTFPMLSSVAIINDTNPIATDDKNGCSCISHLSAQWVDEYGLVTLKKCDYYIWKERFLVKPKFEIDENGEVRERVITIAFPFGERVGKAISSSVFSSFLMTMEANLPFIIQSNFLIKPSRDIIFDKEWNIGVLDSVPSAFVNAFLSCRNSEKKVPFLDLARVFECLPVQSSSPENAVESMVMRAISESIRTEVRELPVVPCEPSSGEEVVYAMPRDVRRLLPDFRKLLNDMEEQGARLKRIPSDTKLILHSSLDSEKLNEALKFLGVDCATNDPDWYVKCIQTCNLVSEASEEVYVDLLCFLACNWSFLRQSTVAAIPILKYVAKDKVRLCSIAETRSKEFNLHYSINSLEHAWINKWWTRFDCPNNIFLLPDLTQAALLDHERKYVVCAWLQLEASVSSTNVRDYSALLVESLSKSSNLDAVIALPYFLHESLLKNFVSEAEVCHICQLMPIVDGCGHVHTEREETLVPAGGSKWLKLFGSNPYTQQKYIDLGSVYEDTQWPQYYLSSLVKYTKAVDLHQLQPPDVALIVASSQLTAEQAFLLLDWLRALRERGVLLPSNFIGSIKNGKWLKTVWGFSSPNECLLLHEEVTSTRKEEVKEILHTAIIDEQYYEDKIRFYVDELKMIGVRVVL